MRASVYGRLQARLTGQNRRKERSPPCLESAGTVRESRTAKKPLLQGAPERKNRQRKKDRGKKASAGLQQDIWR